MEPKKPPRASGLTSSAGAPPNNDVDEIVLPDFPE